jgi:predicted RNase H-like HicB family nuclease
MGISSGNPISPASKALPFRPWHRLNHSSEQETLGVYCHYEVFMKYKIALQRSDEGYSVSVPGLPGCWSQGATEEEALANIQDAIREYLEARDELLRDALIKEIEVAG